MVILSIPREDVLGCQSPLTRNIGPGPPSHIVGTQGKIGPHTFIIETLAFYVKKIKIKGILIIKLIIRLSSIT